ncbi:hypothetical protein B0H11DRAFT_2294667, partial [Mycena galericulata]
HTLFPPTRSSSLTPSSQANVRHSNSQLLSQNPLQPPSTLQPFKHPPAQDLHTPPLDARLGLFKPLNPLFLLIFLVCLSPALLVDRKSRPLPRLIQIHSLPVGPSALSSSATVSATPWPRANPAGPAPRPHRDPVDKYGAGAPHGGHHPLIPAIRSAPGVPP